MRSESKVVVIGGGVAGCSVLYHLTKRGWSDVVTGRGERAHERVDLARRRPLHADDLELEPDEGPPSTASISTRHNRSRNRARRRLPRLQAASGSPPRRNRRRRVSQPQGHRGDAWAFLSTSSLSRERARELHPLANLDDMPRRSRTCRQMATSIRPASRQALAKGAKNWAGRKSTGNTQCHGDRARRRQLDRQDQRGRHPRRDRRQCRGTVGEASRPPRRSSSTSDNPPGAPLPHHRAGCRARAGSGGRSCRCCATPTRPSTCARRAVRLLVGPFERQHGGVGASREIPDDFHSSLLAAGARPARRICLEGCRPSHSGLCAMWGSRAIVNGPDGYTPDGHCLMGPVPGPRGLSTSSPGFSIFGIVFGGGAGKYAAEWIVEGQPR